MPLTLHPRGTALAQRFQMLEEALACEAPIRAADAIVMTAMMAVGIRHAAALFTPLARLKPRVAAKDGIRPHRHARQHSIRGVCCAPWLPFWRPRACGAVPAFGVAFLEVPRKVFGVAAQFDVEKIELQVHRVVRLFVGSGSISNL
ncbi:MAG: hypothetical protein H0W40_11935 [Methylibium sp.]|uniref:hypothetical protein n=1 Tax=Methylibium sp. TaxID=2067992 RepID=UPI00180B3DD5|nr:hypothetical protein [Methylibium sp.]MBA3598067.1 hypothetical protein [Methylibium sp.]